MEPLNMTGRTALITGGARGIGLETGRALYARGASVALLDLDRGATEAAAATLGERALGLECDVTDPASVKLAVEATIQRFGRLDVAVANAGIAQVIEPCRTIDDEAFDRVIAVDLHGVVNTVRHCLAHVVEQRGHVLVISSIYAFMNGMLQASYAMSKAAVEQYGRALRVELAPHGVSAGVGYFGFVDTVMVEEALADPIASRTIELTPRLLRKKISPAEAGEALAAGIEQRAAKTVRPRRWLVWWHLRGVLNPLSDRWARTQPEIAAAIRDAERGRG